jgi:hypothetical protein
MDEGGSRSGEFLSKETQCGGPLGRAPLLGTMEDMLKRFWIRASLSIGAPVGNLEGIRLPGLMREKDSITEFLSWTHRTLRF